jgi:hypothetical protein
MYLIERKKTKKKITDDDFWDFQNELIYWRKANQIHKFFCDKGEEIKEQISYKLKKEDLQELLDICNRILDEVKTEKGKVSNGYSYEPNEDGEFIKKYNYTDGLIITNPEICEELLPTQSGFFFGSTDYDEYYLEDIKYTKEKLEQVIDNIDYDNNDIYYLASW